VSALTPTTPHRRYNKEGDLVVSCAKDLQPCLWFAENGQRIGTFVGHNGAIWSCDINQESTRLITASADSSVRIWNMNGGEELFKVALNEPCRAISYALGERQGLQGRALHGCRLQGSGALLQYSC
jgi:translation initiation factor 3 subunit I